MSENNGAAVVVVIALLVSATATAAAETAPKSGGHHTAETRLTFAWGARTTMRVRHQRVRSAPNGPTQSARFEWITDASRQQGEIHVVNRSMELIEPALPRDQVRDMLSSSEAIVRVVSGDGREVIRVDGVDAALAKRAPPGVKGEPDRVAAIARAAILDTERESWYFMVGAWVELSTSDELEHEVALPTSTGSELSLTYSVHRGVACADRDRARRCVKVNFRSTKPTVERGPNGQSGRASVVGFVVTEPTTLRPHAFRLEKRIEVEEAGRPAASTKDQSHYEFTYP